MTRALILAIAAMVGSCSASNRQLPDDQANDLLAWSRRNPPVSKTTWRAVDKMVCRPEVLDVCDSKGCLARKIDGKLPILVSWNPGNGDYYRCDPNGGGCDTYKPTISYSGSFMHATLPSTGLTFWLTASGEYREIVNMMTDTYVYRGQCNRE